MFLKQLGLLFAVLCFTSASYSANKVPGFAKAQQSIEFWDAGAGFSPVYYGKVTSTGGGFHSCLALAFFAAENNQISYSHKMWPMKNGSCQYDNETSLVVDNATACVIDTDRPKGSLVTTRKMTLKNIIVDPSGKGIHHDIFRIVDFEIGRAGQFNRCPTYAPYDKVHKGALANAKKLGKSKYTGSAGLVSVKVENGRFKMQTRAKLIYNVNLDYVDTQTEAPPADDVY